MVHQICKAVDKADGGGRRKDLEFRAEVTFGEAAWLEFGQVEVEDRGGGIGELADQGNQVPQEDISRGTSDPPFEARTWCRRAAVFVFQGSHDVHHLRDKSGQAFNAYIQPAP